MTQNDMCQVTVTLPVDYGILPKLQGEIGQYEGHMCHVTVTLPVDYGILPKLQGEIGHDTEKVKVTCESCQGRWW